MSPPTRFLALDFETADYGPDSACALGLVRVEDGRVTARATHYVRPPRRSFHFTYIHGITWEDVRTAPTFGELWPALRPMFSGVDFLVAHNASFDRSVLKACCAAAGVKVPVIPFRCTVQVARRTWNIYPTKLPDVCRRLGIPLDHHEVSSDVEACAQIMIRAMKEARPVVP